MIKYVIGDGKKTFLWFDSWHPYGPIIDKWGNRVRYDAALDINAKVSVIVNGSQWKWPVAVTNDLLEIQSSIPDAMKPDSNKEDRVIWVPASNGEFSTASAWEAIRNKKNHVEWSNIVWFSRNIPKHAFILWLAIQNRLSTQEKLLQWGVIDDMKCVFCSARVENMNHLFFGCPYAGRIWKDIQQRCLISRQIGTWQDEVKWMVQVCKKDSLSVFIIKIGFAASVYHIWLERNNRVHGGRPKDEERIIDSIKWEVKYRSQKLQKVENNLRNRNMCSRWDIDDCILKSLT